MLCLQTLSAASLRMLEAGADKQLRALSFTHYKVNNTVHKIYLHYIILQWRRRIKNLKNFHLVQV